MKKIFHDSLAMRVMLLSCQSIIAILLITSLFSCSSVTSGRSLFGSDEDEGQKKTDQMVSKEQYDQLLAKYEKLLKQTRGESQSQRKRDQSSSPKQVPNSDNPEEIVQQLNKIEPELAKSSKLDSTVDVFNKNQSNSSSGSDSDRQSPVVETGKTPSYDEIDVSGQIERLREAKSLVAQSKYDSALSLLKKLENSQVRQVSVRAKFYMGELFFDQEEYDLAMQIFEDILQKDAFSGVVIKSLGRLIVCSEKLQLKKKKEQYYSILHDFFEQS